MMRLGVYAAMRTCQHIDALLITPSAASDELINPRMQQQQQRRRRQQPHSNRYDGVTTCLTAHRAALKRPLIPFVSFLSEVIVFTVKARSSHGETAL